MEKKKELLGIDGLDHAMYALASMIALSLLIPPQWKIIALSVMVFVQFIIWYGFEYFQAKKMKQGANPLKWSLARRKDMVLPALCYVSFFLGAVLKFHGIN